MFSTAILCDLREVQTSLNNTPRFRPSDASSLASLMMRLVEIVPLSHTDWSETPEAPGWSRSRVMRTPQKQAFRGLLSAKAGELWTRFLHDHLGLPYTLLPAHRTPVSSPLLEPLIEDLRYR